MRYTAKGNWMAGALLIALLALGGCRETIERDASDSLQTAAATGEQNLLDSTFRIDIRTIAVVLDYIPSQSVVDGRARLEFVMRPGQSLPRFHFTPAQKDPATVGEIRLDGEILKFGSSSDVRTLSVGGSSQPIIELQRPLSAGAIHVLEVAYRLVLPAEYPRFSTEVNDLAGRGNEALFPTLNTPHELARHRLTLRVHGAREFRCLASGLLQRSEEPDVQQWLLDTEREIASYTLMFVLMPASDTQYEERLIGGVPVRIMAYNGGASIAEGFRTLETWLPQLQAEIGPYPAPRGLNVFLASIGGGMEYYGGTISTLRALRHEVLHGYFGCSTVMKTYRDSWLDEAITQWFDDTAGGETYSALPDEYVGNWVGARSPVSVGYSDLAYTDGARIMQSISDRLGGRERMRAFLSDLHRRRSFQPFSTMDFVSFLKTFAGVDLQTRFQNWLYNGEAQDAGGTGAAAKRKEPDLTPPAYVSRASFRETDR